jgi:hypothetical protein
MLSFLVQVYLTSEFCPSVLEIAGFRVPARYIRDFAFKFTLLLNCPSLLEIAGFRVPARYIRDFEFKFTLLLNSVLLFWKLLVFEFQLGISETLLFLVSAPRIEIAPPYLLLLLLLLLLLYKLSIKMDPRQT